MSSSSGGEWSYRTGPWFAAFGPRVTVLLPESQRDQVVGVWSLVDGGAAFDEVLDALLASGLSRLPGFVLVSSDDGPTRVLLRGTGVSATLTAGDEEVTLDGSTGGTWVERTLEGVTSLSVSVDGDVDETAQPDTDFAVVTGLVRVSRIDRPPYAPPTPAGTEAAALAPGPATEDMEPPSFEEVAAVEEPPSPEPSAVEEPPSSEPAAVEEPPAADEPSPLDEPSIPEVVTPEDPASGTGAGGTPPSDPQPAEPAPSGWVTPWDTPPAEEQSPSAVGDDLPMTEQMPVPFADLDDEAAAAEPAEAGPMDAGPVDAGPMDAEPVDAEPMDAGPVDVEPADAEPVDAEPGEAETPSTPVSGQPVTEYAPSPYDPPPPAPDAPAADLPPPPLPVGSWEPVGGSAPPPPDGGFAPPPAAPDAPVAGAVAKLMISDGQQVLVDRPVLIGRAPEARRFSAADEPHLVAVPSRLHEISSTHVEVRPGTGADHGSAVVTDMGSTNGTVLVQPGSGPEDLKPGIAVPLAPGAIINLGDGITIQVTRA